MEQNIKSVWPEWEIEDEPIGEGSYGKVYKAVKREHGVEMFSAIKIITIPKSPAELKSLNADGMTMDESRTYLESIVNSCVSEIKTMVSLNSASNIVNIYDYKVIEKPQQIGWEIYIRMELLTGFDDYIAGKNFTETEIIKIGIDICSALELCAKQMPPLIHRDIKPGNIFAARSGDFKLGDFGIARELEKSTSLFSMAGTPNYMAPEVSRGDSYGAHADIYSLGIVLYRLSNSKRLPFCDLNKQMLNPSDYDGALRKRLKGEPLSKPVNASDRMAEVILKACTYNPKDRFQSASEFKAALQGIESGKEHKKPGNKKLLKWLIPATALFAVIIFVYALFMFMNKNDKEAFEGKDNASFPTFQSSSIPDNLETPPVIIENVMSDYIFDFTVKIENDVVKLPVTLEVFQAYGWNQTSQLKTSLIPSEYISAIFSNNGKTVYVQITNMSDEVRDISRCTVTRVEIMYTNTSAASIELSKGIKAGISSKKDILAAFGEPTDINDSDYKYTMTYYYEGDASRSVELSFENQSEYIDSNVLNGITIENSIRIESDVTEIGDKVTEKEKDYRPPAELGNDLTSFIVQLEGDLYRLPAPLSAFLDNGFKIVDPPTSWFFSPRIFEYLPGMTGTRSPQKLLSFFSSDYVYIKKGNITYTVDVYNYSDEPLVIERGFVTGISLPSSENREQADFILSGDITFGTPEIVLIEQFGRILNEINLGENDLGYNYKDDRRGQLIDIRFDFNTKLTNSIEIRNAE